MNDDLIQRHENLINRIFNENYYPKILKFVQENYKFDISNPLDICSFWNNFWYLLPDSREIRFGPFFEVCEMAEGSYLEDLENTNEEN